MAFPWPWIIASILGGMALGSGTKSKDAHIVTASALSPEQEMVMEQLTPVMADVLREYGDPRYIEDALWGAERTFDTTIYDPAMRHFENVLMPEISKAYAGPGTYWGSDRAGAQAQAARDIASGLASTRATYMSEAEQRARDNQMAQLNQVMAFMGLPTTATFGVPRQPSMFENILSMAPNLLATYLLGKNPAMK